VHLDIYSIQSIIVQSNCSSLLKYSAVESLLSPERQSDSS
jgi:hypothetical protein